SAPLAYARSHWVNRFCTTPNCVALTGSCVISGRSSENSGVDTSFLLLFNDVGKQHPVDPLLQVGALDGIRVGPIDAVELGLHLAWMGSEQQDAVADNDGLGDGM